MPRNFTRFIKSVDNKEQLLRRNIAVSVFLTANLN